MKYPLILIEFLLYKLCDVAFLTSKSSLQYIKKKYKINNHKLYLIPNCINTELFKKTKTKKYRKKIIYVGRLDNQQKNLLALIKSLEGLNITLDVIGEGKLKKEMESLAKKCSVNINFLGKVDNFKLPFYLNKYLIFILPSKYEGMPKTLLEAMACGLACIATDVQGSDEVINDGINGLLAKDYSAKEIRKQIIKLFNNPVLQNQLGKNAREYILNNFSLDKVIKKEIRIYKELLKK